VRRATANSGILRDEKEIIMTDFMRRMNQYERERRKDRRTLAVLIFMAGWLFGMLTWAILGNP